MDIPIDTSMDYLENPPIPFGKWRGVPIRDIDKGYLEWCLNKLDHPWVQENRELIEDAISYFDESCIEPYELAEDQQIAADQIDQWLFEDGYNVARLQGGAGYGKSFAVKENVIRARRRGYTVKACATSYVATQNLAKDIDPLGVVCGTIARTLRLDVKHDGPKETYVACADTYEVLTDLLSSGNMLIVDEYSMVSDPIGDMLIEHAESCGGKLLVVGDVYQLPSPEQDWDSSLSKVEPAAELVIPKRYSPDSDLFKVENIARSMPWVFSTVMFMDSSTVRQVRSRDELTQAYVDSYLANPGESHLMVWFRRADMVASNRAIRAKLFDDSEEICAGEALRVQRTSDYTATYNGDGVRVYSGSVLDVEHVEKVDVEFVMHDTVDDMGYDPLKFNIPAHRVRSGELIINVLFSVTENSAEDGTYGADAFNAALREVSSWCANNKNWKPYRAFRNMFVQVAYQYASTVHRVQGQSVDHVFTSPAELRKADPYTAEKLQYVGLTRAKKTLTCL